MPFGLCNTPATFQRCMTAIFYELIEDNMEVFMDDFSIFSGSFDHCLKKLEKMLKRYEETNLMLNWEKCHFMVKEGIFLVHKVFRSGIEVDKAKIKVISKLPYPTNVKAIRSFLGHAGFYKRFIKDFSQVARPMTQLLVKDAPFNFSEECIQAFDNSAREKNRQIFLAHTLCQQNDERSTRKLHNDREGAFGCRLRIRQIPSILSLIQDYRFHGSLCLAIRDTKGAKNLATDHLSRLENPNLGKLTKAEIRDLFPEERLMAISDKNNEPWMSHSYSNNVQTKSYEGVSPKMRQYESFDNVTAAHQEGIMVLPQPRGKSSKPCSTGQIYYAMHVDWSELAMPVSEPATSPQGMKHLKIAIDYVSKLVEAQEFPVSDARNVVNFLKILFARFGILKALISDSGTHFCNYQMERVMKRCVRMVFVAFSGTLVSSTLYLDNIDIFKEDLEYQSLRKSLSLILELS
ncbi:reverse transcriptase domain-containing protein [Tanacetum coccineum]